MLCPIVSLAPLRFLAAIAQRDPCAFAKKDSDLICDIPVDANNALIVSGCEPRMTTRKPRRSPQDAVEPLRW
jgi:hypothetical protein